ncbi:hypothetical protein BJ508DRAFT_167386 [Ascobolus immersus RN42]|uniref:Uncharacterized protein n=1 Tax=Ascobolus immersus RN42 TaxID=1160509 RepID=A0A3N4IHZ3_ASCIM|nr:hypothetical protein BJ508DRAFT_167386 [Ascobolus immersus RN42]
MPMQGRPKNIPVIAFNEPTTSKPIKRKRGRPRKSHTDAISEDTMAFHKLPKVHDRVGKTDHRIHKLPKVHSRARKAEEPFIQTHNLPSVPALLEPQNPPKERRRKKVRFWDDIENAEAQEVPIQSAGPLSVVSRMEPNLPTRSDASDITVPEPDMKKDTSSTQGHNLRPKSPFPPSPSSSSIQPESSYEFKSAFKFRSPPQFTNDICNIGLSITCVARALGHRLDEVQVSNAVSKILSGHMKEGKVAGWDLALALVGVFVSRYTNGTEDEGEGPEEKVVWVVSESDVTEIVTRISAKRGDNGLNACKGPQQSALTTPCLALTARESSEPEDTNLQSSSNLSRITDCLERDPSEENSTFPPSRLLTPPGSPPGPSEDTITEAPKADKTGRWTLSFGQPFQRYRQGSSPLSPERSVSPPPANLSTMRQEITATYRTRTLTLSFLGRTASYALATHLDFSTDLEDAIEEIRRFFIVCEDNLHLAYDAFLESFPEDEEQQEDPNSARETGDTIKVAVLKCWTKTLDSAKQLVQSLKKEGPEGVTAEVSKRKVEQLGANTVAIIETCVRLDRGRPSRDDGDDDCG